MGAEVSKPAKPASAAGGLPSLDELGGELCLSSLRCLPEIPEEEERQVSLYIRKHFLPNPSPGLEQEFWLQVIKGDSCPMECPSSRISCISCCYEQK